jgi:hypothetical protein
MPDFVTAETPRSIEIHDSSGKFPPLMFLCRNRLTEAAREHIRESVEHCLKTGLPMVVELSDLEVFQLLGGKWVKIS